MSASVEPETSAPNASTASGDSSETAALRRTPLYDCHVEAGAKMVPFGAWEMPLHYGSQIEEHHATRRGVGLFDVSHMGQIEVTGRDAAALVQEIVTRDIGDLADGEQAYCAMCNEAGGIIDDLIVARMAGHWFLLVVNAGPYEKAVAQIQKIADGLDLRGVSVEPAANNYAMIAVQGKAWRDIVRPVIGAGLGAGSGPGVGEASGAFAWENLKPYRAAEIEYREGPLIVSTTGYTGEPGCELLLAPDHAAEVWCALIAAGGRPCGLAARDTLRLEKGMCLSGQDFTEASNPFEARLGWVVDLDKESFCGLDALKKIKAEGVARRLVGLLPEGRRIPRHGARIIAGGKPVGEITSGGFSPTLARPIALGYVAKEFAKAGTSLAIDLGGGKTAAARVARPPFGSD